MAYGIQVKDASGNVKVEYTDRLTRLLFTKLLGADTDYSIDASDWGFNKNNGLALTSPLDLVTSSGGNDYHIKLPHVISYTGVDTINATKPSNAGQRADSLLHVFMYKS